MCKVRFLRGSPFSKGEVMKKYSILLMYPDYMSQDWPYETYFTYLRAATSQEAVILAKKEACQENDMLKNKADDFYAILCIAGYIKLEDVE